MSYLHIKYCRIQYKMMWARQVRTRTVATSRLSLSSTWEPQRSMLLAPFDYLLSSLVKKQYLQIRASLTSFAYSTQPSLSLTYRSGISKSHYLTSHSEGLATMAGRKSGVIALFDVDGTLTAPRKVVGLSMYFSTINVPR
jgi:hypothetical protein